MSHCQANQRCIPRLTWTRYLKENATPEWKRAYVDYRTCKKYIKIIALRIAREAGNLDATPDEVNANDSSADDDYGPSAPPRRPRAGTASLRSPNVGGTSGTPRTLGNAKVRPHRTAKLIPEPTAWHSDLYAPPTQKDRREPTAP